MTRLGIVVALLCLVTWGTPNALSADTARSAPDFKQVYDLIRQHLAGASEEQLNQTAVKSLVSALDPKVSIVASSEHEQTPVVLVTKTSLFDGPIAYVRVGQVESGLDKAIREAAEQATTTNQLAGIVLDLRFTRGTDYAAAVATAQIFIKKEQPLLDWGKGMVRSKDNPDSLALPLAILVNEQTVGAAEALAAVLREAGSALILGTHTAGQAMISQDFPLSNGDILRIATTPIQLGDGGNLSSSGIKPDIMVNVSKADQRLYYADPFKELTIASNSDGARTNSPNGATRIRRPRFNEAELVRERRDGIVADSESGGAGEGEDKPVVRDPVLGRALDFLKGLKLVRPARG